MNHRHLCLAAGLKMFLLGCGPEHTIISHPKIDSENIPVAEALLSKDTSAENYKPSDFDQALGRQEFSKKYYFTLDWTKGPKAGSQIDNCFVLQLFQDGHAHTIDYFDFRLYMKIHQHGGLDQKRQIDFADEIGAKIDARGFHFTMSGPWELQIRIVVDGIKFSFDLPVHVKD